MKLFLGESSFGKLLHDDATNITGRSHLDAHILVRRLISFLAKSDPVVARPQADLDEIPSVVGGRGGFPCDAVQKLDDDLSPDDRLTVLIDELSSDTSSLSYRYYASQNQAQGQYPSDNKNK